MTLRKAKLASRNDVEASFRFSYEVTGDEPSGPVSVVVTLADAAGNESVTAFDGQLSFDFTAPQLQPTTPFSAWVKAGDVVALALDFDEPLIGPPSVVLVPTAGGPELALSATPTALEFVASRTVSLSDPQGLYDVVIRHFSDAAGNEGAESAAGSVHIDNAPPHLSAPLSFNKVPPAFCAGDSVAVDVETNQPLASPPMVALLTDPPIALDCIPSGGAYVCSTQAPLSGSEGATGLVSITVQLRDVAGNIGFADALVTLDFDPPSVDPTSLRVVIAPPIASPVATVDRVASGGQVTVSLVPSEVVTGPPQPAVSAQCVSTLAAPPGTSADCCNAQASSTERRHRPSVRPSSQRRYWRAIHGDGDRPSAGTRLLLHRSDSHRRCRQLRGFAADECAR